MSNNKPTVRKSLLAPAGFIAALMPVCSYLEKGDVKNLANRITAIHDHARKKHERDFEECRLCVKNVEEMHLLPPKVSAVALENPLKRTFNQRLGNIIHINAVERFSHNTKRGERDFHHVAALFALHKEHYPEQYRRR